MDPEPEDILTFFSLFMIRKVYLVFKILLIFFINISLINKLVFNFFIDQLNKSIS